MKKVFFKSANGIKLAGIWHVPSTRTHKAVILAHGITVDKNEDGIFVDLANILQDNGFAVFRFDFRGHGESDGKSIEMTISGELQDIEGAVNEVKKKGYKKIGLLGASFGGGIVSLYTPNHQDLIDCLCLWSPCLNYDHIFLHPYLPWLTNDIGRIKTELKEKGWTAVGSQKFTLGKKLFDEMETLFPYKVLRQITIPTLIVHGNKDTYVPYDDSKKYIGNLKQGKLVTIAGEEHGFHNRKEGAKQAYQKTLAFFQKYL